jgi:rhodanese-related sulfurtransferase
MPVTPADGLAWPLLARASPGQSPATMAISVVCGGPILIGTWPEWLRQADARFPLPLSSSATTWNGAAVPAARPEFPKPPATRWAWIACCDEGYSSSLAAASLRALGLHQAADLISGYQA